jgi:hypothetical protein
VRERVVPPWERGAAAAAVAAASGHEEEMDLPPIALPDEERGSPPSAHNLEPVAIPAPGSVELDPARVRGAWNTVIKEGDGVPAGLSLFLKPARLLVQGGEVRVEFPAGSPVMERMGTPASRRPLEEAMARRLGAAVKLVFATGQAAAVEESGGSRITAESAKKDRLRRLAEGEPTLAAAVQAWDLELVE